MSEQEFIELVERLTNLKAQDALIELLDESNPIYNEKGPFETERMRGWILLSLAKGEFPKSAIIYILEELDNSIEAYSVASAAKSLRSYPKKELSFAPYLIKSFHNIRYHDEPISFKSFGSYSCVSEETSAIEEILETIKWLGPSANVILDELNEINDLSIEYHRILECIKLKLKSVDTVNENECCKFPKGIKILNSIAPNFLLKKKIDNIVCEDQVGEKFLYKEFIYGSPTIVVFFYTRCANPLKCSLSISKLSNIHKILKEKGLYDSIKTAAITYDSEYDNPGRLKIYGEDRKFIFNRNHRILRIVEDFDAVKRFYGLGVNFVGTLVNRHRIEVFVVGSTGKIETYFERIQWDECQVVDVARELLTKNRNGVYGTKNKVSLILPQLLGPFAVFGIVFFPKCPFCWAAYMSLFGVVGLESIPYQPWLFPVFILVLMVNLLSVWVRSNGTKNFIPLYLTICGAVYIVLMKVDIVQFAWPGILLTFIGSLLSTLDGRLSLFNKFRNIFEKSLTILKFKKP